MRRRVLLVLISVVVLAGSGGAAVILLDNRVEGSPRETAALYLKAWAWDGSELGQLDQVAGIDARRAASIKNRGSGNGFAVQISQVVAYG